jgi:hypothetical protein
MGAILIGTTSKLRNFSAVRKYILQYIFTGKYDARPDEKTIEEEILFSFLFRQPAAAEAQS